MGNGAMPVPRRYTFRPGHDYATQRRASCGTAPLRSGSSPSRTHAIPRSLFVASHRRVLSREGQGRDSIEPRLLIASYCVSCFRAFHESLCGIGHCPLGEEENNKKFVIPANAGIQKRISPWTPVCTGVTYGKKKCFIKNLSFSNVSVENPGTVPLFVDCPCFPAEEDISLDTGFRRCDDIRRCLSCACHSGGQ